MRTNSASIARIARNNQTGIQQFVFCLAGGLNDKDLRIFTLDMEIHIFYIVDFTIV